MRCARWSCLRVGSSEGCVDVWIHGVLIEGWMCNDFVMIGVGCCIPWRSMFGHFRLCYVQFTFRCIRIFVQLQ